MNEAQRKQVEQDVAELIQQLSAISAAATDHSVVMTALLATFMSVAINHPCCTRNAAEAAIDVGAKLLARSFTAAHGGAQLH